MNMQGTITLNGRMTVAGAYTSAIRLYAASKTELAEGPTHWIEKITWWDPDGLAVVRDVSRGNHRCLVITARGEQFAICADGPVCDRLAEATDNELLDFVSSLRARLANAQEE